MKTLKLNILAKDILETDYLDSYDCPITRALARAGLSDYIDGGTEIVNINDLSDMLIDKTNETYKALTKKVIDMYVTKYEENPDSNSIGICDFEHTLIY